MRKWFVMTMLLCACVHAHWMEAGGPYTPPDGRFALVLPNGWMRLSPDKDHLLATRDGPALQRIYSDRNEFGQPLPGAKKVPRKDMLPEEAAELIRDELAVEGGDAAVSVVENSPATVAGRPGFRLTCRFRTSDGLQMKGVVYGVLGDDALYRLTYMAPERYYFDLDLPTFEKIRQSFRLRSPPVRDYRAVGS
jgi:hypothetical protein